MSTLRNRFTVPMAIALTVLAGPALVGCSGNPIQNIINGATGGKVDLGGNTVPKDFPDDVPLYDGEVLSGAAIHSDNDSVWNVSVRIPDIAAADTIKSDLEAAGFKSEVESEMTKDGGAIVADGDKYGVAVVIAKDDKGFIANYTVTTKSDE